jgi:predicted metal-dependent HD superfamily phosphohydrolase
MKNVDSTEKYMHEILVNNGFSRSLCAATFDAYKESHRKYHTLEHLECMLHHANKPEEPLVMAVALHDICYKAYPVAPGVNEYCSMEAVDFLSKFELPLCKEVKEAILATAFYTQVQPHLSPLAQELCDLDLCNLALDFENYCYWSDLALEEARIIYKNLVKEPIGFSYGQVMFLNKMLRRERLYYIHTEWEEPARKNMERRRNILEEEIERHEHPALSTENG